MVKARSRPQTNSQMSNRRFHGKYFHHDKDFYRRRQPHHEMHAHYHPEEFHRLHRYLYYLRPFALLFNIFIIYLLFRWVGIKSIGIVFAVLLTLKELAGLWFMVRLEKKVFQPIDELEKGFVEITRGNYSVTIDYDQNNQFGGLIDAFNGMARRLQESERINREYEENRKNLLANISHDLKTPITSMQGYIEMLLDQNMHDTGKMQNYLRIIAGNTAYITKLIDDLFLFSKLDMQKMDFNHEVISIRAFVHDLVEEFTFDLEERQSALTYVDKTKTAYEVYIDPKRTYQAIRNIISNSIKYGPPENLQITLSLYTRDNFACIAISDNGPGIPEEKMPYIFDRFYRLDTERSKDLTSTGLGLAIARELIEAQGGNIEVASSAETGTTFTIALPLLNQGKEEDDAKHPDH